MNGNLYLVSTPIGNMDDITLRALEVLKESDMIVCEEFKMGRRLLSVFGIEKDLTELNEHNEKESAEEVIEALKGGENVALISDAGTPLFSDPGHYLVELCLANDIRVVPVPGANSLLPALIGSGLDFERFFYYGWLSPKKEIRRKELKRLKNMQETLVILDTPYRLRTLLKDVLLIFGKHQKIVVAYQLTMKKKEEFLRGGVAEILTEVESKSLKGEFVLLIDNKQRRG